MSEQLRMALAMKSSKKVLRATTKRFEFKVLKLTLFNMVLLGLVTLGGKMNTTLNHPSETTLSDNWSKKKSCQIGLRMQVRNNRQIQLCLKDAKGQFVKRYDKLVDKDGVQYMVSEHHDRYLVLVSLSDVRPPMPVIPSDLKNDYVKVG